MTCQRKMTCIVCRYRKHAKWVESIRDKYDIINKGNMEWINQIGGIFTVDCICKKLNDV